jgi:hypothetical protein
VSQEQRVVGDVGNREGRAHARQRGIVAGGLGHSIVDPAIEAETSPDHVIGSSRIDPDVPLGEMQRKMRKRGNSQATRGLP